MPPIPSLPFRLGLVGLGGHGQNLQRAAEALDSVDVVAVYDPNETEARVASERFGCPATSSFEALLAMEGLEAVVLVTPNSVHRDQTEAALASGKHVLVEKPIANTVADGVAMVEAAEHANRKLMVGHNIRYGRAAREAKARLDRGEIGMLVSVEIHYSADNVQKGTHTGWRFQPGACPLLPMMQLGIHAIDLAQYLAGPVREVVAHTRSVLTAPGVDDNVTALLVFESGVVGTAVSNYCTPDLFQVRVTGTTGLLILDWIPHQLTVLPRGNRTESPEVFDYSALEGEDIQRELQAFGEAIRNDERPETDGRIGLAALAVVEAMAESARAGGARVSVTVRA
jgi:predicted dehydrogenase